MYYRKWETDSSTKHAVDEAHRKAAAERMKAVSKKAHTIRRAKKSLA